MDSFLCCVRCEKEENDIICILSVNSLVAYVLNWLDNYCVFPINSCEGNIHFGGSQ